MTRSYQNTDDKISMSLKPEDENRRLRSELISMTKLCEDVISSRKSLFPETSDVVLQSKIDGIKCNLYTSHIKILLELVKEKFDNKQIGVEFINQLSSLIEEIGFIDSSWYLDYYNDVAEAGYSAGFHYILWGQYEGRIINRSMFDKLCE